MGGETKGGGCTGRGSGGCGGSGGETKYEVSLQSSQIVRTDLR